MKKILTIESNSFHTIKKALFIMKLTFVFLLLGILQVSAKVNGQAKVSLKLNNVEIAKALRTIENQGDYRFLYNNNLKGIGTKINIDVSDAGIKEVLDKMFVGTDLAYKILDNNLIVVLSNTLTLQDIKITGKITGENGEALSGVSVSLKGTSIGTTTDNNGIFTLTVPEKGTLAISSIGYQNQEVNVNSQSVINIKLTPSNRSMDEVVVIGYGTASKRDLTGSIVKVSGKEVADKPNSNPISSLQSKVTGLYIVNDGTPGSTPDVRIRGTVSIGQVHPLYVVDGIFNDNIDYINPNDIESIEILKDPSSLAIFGVKGGTGVIAITTKKAKAGQTIINFNTSYGVKKLVDKIKMANASQFNTLFNEENANNSVATPDYSFLTANTDWVGAVIRNGIYSASNLSVTGSSENNKFNMGLGYTLDQGVVKHEQLQKLMISIGDEFKVNKAIKIGINFNTSRTNNPYNVTSTGTDVLNNARKVMPQVSAATKTFQIANPYNNSDTISANLYSTTDQALQNSGVQNPLIQLENEWDKTIDITYRYVGSAYVDISFLRHFDFRATYYADISNEDYRKYQPLYDTYNPVNDSAVLQSPVTSVTENSNTNKRFQQDYILTYLNHFGEHNLTLTGGFTTYYSGVFNLSGLARPYTNGTALPIPDDSRFWYMTSGFENPAQTIASSSQYEYSTVSFLARALYNYKQKYFLNASFRDDGSSQIPTKNRYQQFWAVGAAWELTREDFMSNQKIFDYLKLKGSIGVLGNQSTPNGINYVEYPQLNTGSAAVFGGIVYNAATNSYIPNPDLKWETVSSQEIGVELNALNNRLHFEGTYFNKVTNNLMTFVDRSSIGQNNELINGGSIRNWGEEFAATWNQSLNKDLTLSIGGNITFLNNVVKSLAADLPSGYLDETFQNNGSAESRTEPGHPIGSFFGYKVAGLYQSNLDILKSPPASSLGTYRPGDFKFQDVDGDGAITSSDRTFIGNPSPKFYYGGTINLTYKGFGLGIDVGGVYGNTIFRTWGSLESPFQRVNYPEFKINSWHGAGTSNWDPIISQGDRFNYNGSTYNIEDGSYFRIRNLQLSYTFTQFKGPNSWAKNMKVYVNVQNLKTWKHNYGYTTEFGGDALGFGYDNAGGAIPVVATAGLNITF
ncbi:MAG TPA: SusC/RagA family TonB-linked outer membrane protein [Puia sp.]